MGSAAAFMSPSPADRAGGYMSPAAHGQTASTLATRSPKTTSPSSSVGPGVTAKSLSDAQLKIKEAMAQLKLGAKAGKKDPRVLWYSFDHIGD